MPHAPTADVARLQRLTRHFATEAVQAGDVAAFPPPAALAELPPVELRRLLDGLLTIRPPREIPDDDVREDLDEMLAAEDAVMFEPAAPSANNAAREDFIDRIIATAKALYEAGVYVNPVLPPATAPNECLLRTSYMATLTEPLLDEAMDIIRDVMVTNHD